MPRKFIIPLLLIPLLISTVRADNKAAPTLLERLNAVRIPDANFERASIHTFVRFLTRRSAELSKDRHPLNVILDLRGWNDKLHPVPVITISLKDQSLDQMFTRASKRLGLHYVIDTHAVVLAVNQPHLDKIERRPDKETATTKALRKKLGTIVIPHISFEEATLPTIAKYLASRSKELDPQQKGVNITLAKELLQNIPKPQENVLDDDDFDDEDDFGFDIEDGDIVILNDVLINQVVLVAGQQAFGGGINWDDTEFEEDFGENDDALTDVPTVTMDLDNVPLQAVLRYVCFKTGLHYTVTDDGVVISRPDQ